MNKILLTAVVALGLLAQSAFAQYTFSASPTSQIVAAGAGTFNVTFSLQVTNTNTIAAFDLYIATAAANSGLFTITSATGQGTWLASGPPGTAFPDIIDDAAAAGFVRNSNNMGFSALTPQTGPFTQAIVTLGFSYTGLGVGSYVLSTTTTANAGAFFSDVSDTDGNVTEGAPGVFTITVVPEPATWSLLGLGGLAAVGLNVLRRRRVS
jgi:hypothetical protein